MAPEGGQPGAGPVPNTRFVRKLVESGLATMSVVRACLADFAKSRASGQDKTLSDIFVEKGVVTRSQVHLLAAAIQNEKEGAGLALLGGYQLLEMIGQGGMGAVYKAKQLMLDRIVALKVLPDRLASSADFIGRFLREARAAAKLDHPNVVRAVDAGEAGGKYYFAMELVEGRSLEDLLQEQDRLPEEQALGIAIQSARGLECAWRNQLVHRDIKPDNILLTKDGVAKIADLGLVKAADTRDATRLTQEGATLGTPHYMSPEQARGEDADIRTDIYALGVVIYRMVTGALPFTGKDPVSIIMARFQQTPAPARDVNPNVSAGLSSVVETMMAFDREHRYPDPAVLLHDLDLVAAGKKPEYASTNEAARRRALERARSRRSATGSITIVRRRHRRELVLGAIGLVAVVAAIVATFGISQRGRPAAVPAGPSPEEVARREELEREAAGLYKTAADDFEAARYAEAVERLRQASEKYAGTSFGPKIDSLWTRASAEVEKAKRRSEEDAGKQAEEKKRYDSLVAAAREELGLGNYERSADLLLQAKAVKESEELTGLLAKAKRLQHLARAAEEERKGDLARAVEFLELAAGIQDDADVRGRVDELKRRLGLADRIATGERLVAEGRFEEARSAFGEAMDRARGDEKSRIDERLKAVEVELRYASLMAEARVAARTEKWREAIARAEAALALSVGDREALSIVATAKEALGPEPEVTNSIGMALVLVPAGEFVMGDAGGDDDEKPAHRARLSAYYIGKYEVTNAQFERFNPAHRFKWKQFSPADDMPAIAVTWEEAFAFSRWLGEKEGIEYRLPTEAEWEMAARGTDGRRYPWGNDAPETAGAYRSNFAAGKDRKDWARDGFTFAAPVGSYPAGASPHGCHDMAGNVWEWCLDWYAAGYYREAPEADPTGPDAGTRRVVRGGSFGNTEDTLRSANRRDVARDLFEANVGFRCVRAVKARRRENAKP